MPRRSTASLTVAAFAPDRGRLGPPPELGGVEADVFRQTVASVSADYFAAENMTLLCAYARAAALERRAAEELQACAVGLWRTTGNHGRSANLRVRVRCSTVELLWI